MKSIRSAIAKVAIGALTLTACSASAMQADAVSSLSITVSGNHLVDSSGQTVTLRGFNRSGTQYACSEGWGIFDGPVDSNAISVMKTWGRAVNAVRVSLNEACWLGINGVSSAYGGVNYQTAIAAFVQRLEDQGLYPILDLHFADPGSTLQVDQVPMPDVDHSVDFWTSVANYFKSDPAVIFDLFNEPYPNSNTDTAASWQCVRDGSAGGTCTGFSYQAVGMQALLNAVRDTGATNVVMVSGPQYAGDLDRWNTYAPIDPVSQMVASIHVYWNTASNPDWSPCYLASCWDAQIAPIAANVPVVTGEFGQHTCTADLYSPYLNWADSHGVSYLAWAWFVQSRQKTRTCGKDEPAVISNYSTGAPSGEGQAYHDHLAGL